MIDIPLCLSRAKSLYSPSISNPNNRLINLLMRHGRKSLISKLYSLSMVNISKSVKPNSTILPKTHAWQFVYSLFVQPKVVLGRHGTSIPLIRRRLGRTHITDKYNQAYSDLLYFIPGNNWLYDLLFDELERYYPTFSFYVKKIDKLRRKHSRGRTGQYEIIWKYVPMYKRVATVLHWITKDIKFQRSRTFYARFERSLETMIFDRTSHLTYRLRQFVHKFVFEKHKKTLLKTLRSVS